MHVDALQEQLARGLLEGRAPAELVLLVLRHLSLNIFCQYIYLRMYVIPAADLQRLPHHADPGVAVRADRVRRREDDDA